MTSLHEAVRDAAFETIAEVERRRDGITLEQEATRLAGSLTEFVRSAWHVVWPNERYTHGRHIEAICEHLEAVSQGEIRYLQIWVPPGSSKSTIVSIMWPAWEWASRAHLRYITASYAEPLATGFSVKSRDLIRSSWYQARWPKVQLKRDQDLKKSYANTQGGERFATSPGGEGTGKHAHRIIIDDALNAKEITSEAALNAVREWHDGTIALRHIPGGGTSEVIIQQRLDERDLAGHVLDLDPEAWTVLCLPEEYEPAHPYAWNGDWREQPGDLLWPEVVNEDEHDRRMLNLGAHRAAGQLQQRPSAREGAILKRAAWRFFPASWLEDGELHYLPRFTALVQSWDTAFKDRTSSDFVVGGLWGQTGADLYLLTIRRERMSLSATKQAMRDMHAMAETRWPRLTHRILIEKSANGVEIIEELKRELRGVTPVVASVSKVARAEAAEPALEAGNVYLPGQAMPESPSGYNEALTPAFAQALIEECVDGATRIITRDGLKRADDLDLGDMVLTHRGRFRPIVAKSSQWADDRVRIKAKTLDPLILTGNHPVYAMELSTSTGGRRPIGAGWKPAGDLRPRTFSLTQRGTKEPTFHSCDAMTIPILDGDEPLADIDLRQWYAYPEETKANRRSYRAVDDGDTITLNTGRSTPLIYNQKLNWTFGALCGLYLAEGSYSLGRAQWSFHSDEKLLQQFVVDTVRDRLGLAATAQTPKKSPNCTIMTVSAPRLEAWFDTFGKGAANKRVPWWAWDGSDSFLRGILDGWLDGDGHNEVGTTVSPDLAWGMRLIGARLGKWPTITLMPRAGLATSIRGREVFHRHDALSVNYQTRDHSVAVSTDEHVGLWLSEKEPAEPGMVFNFTVDEDESYVTTGGTVHNCAVFPNGAHDDQVDMLTQAVNYTRGNQSRPMRVHVAQTRRLDLTRRTAELHGNLPV